MQGRLFLDVVVGKSATILKLLPGEDQTLLVRRNTLLVLDLGFDIRYRVGRLNIKGDSFPCQCFDKDLHFQKQINCLVKVIIIC